MDISSKPTKLSFEHQVSSSRNLGWTKKSSSIDTDERNREWKSLVTFIYTEETHIDRNQVELFELNERVLEKARSKERKNKKVKLGLHALKQWLLQVKSLFILMKTVIFICRGRNAGIANAETYRDKQGHTRTNRDRQGKTRTCRDRQVHSLALTGIIGKWQCEVWSWPICVFFKAVEL